LHDKDQAAVGSVKKRGETTAPAGRQQRCQPAGEDEKRPHPGESLRSLFERLAELDQRGVAAILIDANLKIVGVTSACRPLIGDMAELPPRSALAAFARGKAARGSVLVGDRQRTVLRLDPRPAAGGYRFLVLN
jgi:hypothetical protein